MISDGSFRLDGKLALVTGASRGIGYSLSKELAARGAHVIAVARTVGGLEELDDEIKAAGGTATLVPLDLTDMPAIDRLGGSIHERWGKLDIMVANAGILGTISPIGHVEAKVFDRLMAINVTSVWRLIRTTDPLLKLSDAGRAILLSSGVAHTARAYWGPYAASKAAVEVMARTWAEESQQTRLRINSVNPGATRTAMRAQAMPGEDPETLPTPTEVAAKIALLCDPALDVTGKLYDVRADKLLSYNDPS
ncbi:NAD(P)-dependent dehydrogenase (short-subunit alcohol dehydrogenase family) [Phyllobacterium trifolii]|jgi:NAD(P)-dependent dehydrogenase (short-subunit alcohol dehydrogenase family)|uniref:NAD(P)-dependent dehydrogenase (Short-subunit alcohol dehydrogenase family) n=1 Tax=Phyllobacterium trifolii TaxID=300193 RepID=A0A839TZL6_9HYPH|nr:SDR family NAD(P)-dependent oxidoreductase [Phyllobacterium trifolii]MBB3144076.1 NAD(P)-dependent dehydrogenase (short-subunit alcohol dehydrogenase family) [Phyllobacterium trifolii]